MEQLVSEPDRQCLLVYGHFRVRHPKTCIWNTIKDKAWIRQHELDKNSVFHRFLNTQAIFIKFPDMMLATMDKKEQMTDNKPRLTHSFYPNSPLYVGVWVIHPRVRGPGEINSMNDKKWQKWLHKSSKLINEFTQQYHVNYVCEETWFLQSLSVTLIISQKLKSLLKNIGLLPFQVLGLHILLL